MRSASHICLGLLLLSLFAGCGGGAGGIVSPVTTSALPPIGALDGFLDDHGYVDTTGAAGGILVGDNLADAVGQGFLTFDLTVLPAGAVVLAATLEIRQFDVTGAPYVGLGSVLVDHVDVGGALDPSDWGAAALDGNFAAASHDASLGALTVDVATQVTADLHAGRTRSSYRLGFTALTDGDGAQDTAHFQDAEDHEGSGILPQIVVTWR